MRRPRTQQISGGDLVHSTWRGHNHEWIFAGDRNKETYLELMATHVRPEYPVHVVCVMNSHDHSLGQPDTVASYSRFCQLVHGQYAQRYNSQTCRDGAVGSGRPRTVVVRDERHQQNAAFYIDANPVRAGIVKHPRDYRWSSYNYYAYGKQESWSVALTSPQWYLRLGRTPGARQRAYRRLCDSYLRSQGLLYSAGGLTRSQLRPLWAPGRYPQGFVVGCVGARGKTEGPEDTS